ncbi:alpha-amylase [Candidatus Dojkabacteria bacterium]|nr:alpha-amylase [Candidatus Dojkabacteria bacterium]
MYKKSICFYFQVHQPWRLSKVNILRLAEQDDLFEGFGHGDNKAVFKKVAEKCYLPTNKLLYSIIKKHPEVKVTFSLSGVFLDQAECFDKRVIKSFKKLLDTGNVELMNETYYHSLAWLFSKKEFAHQIKMHRSKIWKLFKRRPVFFRNTELIYNNQVANFARLIGFNGIVAEGWDPLLNGQNPNFVYNAKTCDIHPEDRKIADDACFTKRRNHKIKLLLKNYRLSDDIAFRFSNKDWPEYPLTVEKYADWIEFSDGNTYNLFLDYETFGEHQWEETGIFEFLRKLPTELLQRNIYFRTVSETIKDYRVKGEIDIHNLISWADESRDLSAWVGNRIQEAAIKAVYDLEPRIIALTKGKKRREEKDALIEIWRRLQTSDHFYYMCTKYWNDGDVHKYFSHYESPYNAFINFMNCFNDFVLQLDKFEQQDKKDKIESKSEKIHEA